MGPYVIDFYCASAKLGVEVDGIAHEMGDRLTQDEVRGAFLAEQGTAVDVAEAIGALCRGS